LSRHFAERNLAIYAAFVVGQCLQLHTVALARGKMTMKNSFLVTVAAAALFATTGLAAAQGMNPSGAKGGESPAESKSESVRPSKSNETSPSMAKEAPSSEAKPGSSAQDKTGTKAMPRQAQDKSAPAMDKKSSTQTSGEMNKDTKSKSSSDTSSPAGSKTSEETPAAGTTKNGAAAQTKSGTQTTTGNAATSATAAPPAEKRSQIVSAIKSEKVEEVTNVNFNISVGTTVPSSIHFYPLPPRIVEIYPEWRGYDFILVRGRYIVLRPQTHEIVYIIED
jgi:hypothetical protein